MKFIILCFITLLHLSASAQPSEEINRRSEIEYYMEYVYSAEDFQRMADLLQMSVGELSDYPVFSPVKQPVVSSEFGWRRHPIRNVWQFHTGIDIPKAKGTPVYAAGNGIVVRKGYNSGYGYFIEIKHAGNFRSFYAHLSKTMVNVGDSVSMTEQIACVGNSGVSTGNHLHYEVRKSNRFLSPSGWCYYFVKLVKKH